MEALKGKGKRFYYKVYNSDGTLNTIWHNEVMNEPQFEWNINSGHGTLKIDLARENTNFGEGDDVKINNEVYLFVASGNEEMVLRQTSYSETLWDAFYWNLDNWDYEAAASDIISGGKMIYHGIIRSYIPFTSGDKEYVTVNLVPYAIKLGDKIMQDDDGNTTEAFNSYDPSDILKCLIDYQGGDFSYYGIVDDTGTTVSYTFKFVSYKEAIDKVIELCPSYWYYYIDGEDNIYLKQSDFNTIDHSLYVGKEVSDIEATKDTESMVNVVYFLGGGDTPLYKKYENDSSINAWGRREIKKKDTRVTLESTASIMADKILNEKAMPLNEMKITIISDSIDTTRGYNLESICPGDIIQVNHPEISSEQTLWDAFFWDEDNWDYDILYSLGQPMQVQKINYKYNELDISLSSTTKDVVHRIEDLNRNKDETDSENIPDSPT